MKTYHLLLSMSIALLFISCGVKEANQVEGQDVASTEEVIETKTPNEIPELELTVGNAMLDQQIKDLQEQYAGLPNTLELTYSGFEFGDYPHITFTDGAEKYFDFGNGSNDLGEYETIMMEENSQYVGKKFKVSWDWRISSFSCCQGSMDAVVAKVPSITKITMME